MNKKYELVVKGINNYGDKVTVTVKSEGDGQASLLLPDVAISLDRTEGARWSFTKLRRKSRRSSFSWMLLPGYVNGTNRCRKSAP